MSNGTIDKNFRTRCVERIKKILGIKAQVEPLEKELSDHEEALKTELLTADLNEFECTHGTVKVTTPETAEWDIDAAIGSLKSDEIEQYFPRTPKKTALKKRMESDEDFANRLAHCYTMQTLTPTMKVEAAA